MELIEFRDRRASKRAAKNKQVSLRIGLDFDDTIVDHMGGLRDFLGEMHGISMDLDKLESTSWGRSMGLTTEEENAFMWQLWHTVYYTEASPIRGALDGIKQISQIGALGIVTARLKSHDMITRRWIKRFCPGAFKLGINYAENPYHNISGENKPQISKRLKLDVVVEDSIYSVLALAKSEHPTPTILLTQPWNKGFEMEGVRRVDNWEHIVTELTRMQRVKESRIFGRKYR